MVKAWRPLMTVGEREKLDQPFPPDLPPSHFDRDGEAISLADWCEAMADLEYRRVAKDHIGKYHISTVWLGLDHGFGFLEGHSPLIFETMVFDEAPEAAVSGLGGRKTAPGRFQARYSTEDEAMEGHAEAVLAAEAGLIGEEEW